MTIVITSAAFRSFYFPAERSLAYDFFSDLRRVIGFIPHIEMEEEYDFNQLRLRYTSTELGAYQITIVSDVKAALDQDKQLLEVLPLYEVKLKVGKASLTSAITYGHYASHSVFKEADQGTQIDYRLELRAKLPRPAAMRFMPQRAVNQVAANITKRRVEEMIDGFIEGSTAAFPDWVAQRERGVEVRFAA